MKRRHYVDGSGNEDTDDDNDNDCISNMNNYLGYNGDDYQNLSIEPSLSQARISDDEDRSRKRIETMDESASSMHGGGGGGRKKPETVIVESSREIGNTFTKVHINSNDRDQLRYPKASHFRVPLVNPNSQHLKSIELTSISLPLASYLINSGNDRLYLTEVSYSDGSGNYDTPRFYMLKVPHGNYTIVELVDMLNSIRDQWVNIEPTVPRYVEADHPLVASVDRQMKNRYTWAYTLQPTPRVYFGYDPTTAIVSPTTAGLTIPYRVYIHCPPLGTGLAPLLGDSVNHDTFTRNEQQRISSITCTGPDTLKLSFPSDRLHNIGRGAIAEWLNICVSNDQTSTHPSGSWRVSHKINMVMFPSFTTDPTATATVTLYISGIENTLKTLFSVTDLSTLSMFGIIRMVASNGNLWPTLGFTKTNSYQYSATKISGVSVMRHTYGTTPGAGVPNQRVTTSEQIINTTNIYIKGSNLPSGWGNLGGSPYSVVVGSPQENNTIELAAGTLPMTAGATEIAALGNAYDSSNNLTLPDWEMYVIGQFFGDRVFDLRLKTMVALRVMIGSHQYIGEYRIASYDQSGTSNLVTTVNPYFAIFPIENVRFGEVFNATRQNDGYLGLHNFFQKGFISTRANRTEDFMTLTLYADNGTVFALEDLGWSATFECVWAWSEN